VCYTLFDGRIDNLLLVPHVMNHMNHMNLEPLYRSIGSVIRAKRRQRDWTQEQLALKLMISRGTLANIEAGRQRIFLHQLYSIAAALELKPVDLLPPVTVVASTPEAFPLPENLNAQQREQLARLIQSADPTHPPGDKVNEKK
jgi:transcriptional regulator with XRE-family HTH domain